MFICKLTGTKGKPVKAHIIPKAFYEIPPQEGGPMVLMTNVAGERTRPLPIGIYDKTIVTIEGERIFGSLDDYAINTLITKRGSFKEHLVNGQPKFWELHSFDYYKLKLFALSILWRASASSQPAFNKVKLGPHEERIREMIQNGDSGTPEQYSVNIFKWIDDGFGQVFIDPINERFDGINHYRVYCGRYIFSIKVDSRSSIKGFAKVQLNPQEPLFIIARELRTSKEWPIMQKIARNSQ